ncbi:outer membrane lipoprotein chaperone LolA [Aquabacterium fontiphilum]|uniref:outer membrane lipoprotein chaperone LolA n=1 Tax=Aquabacterium fontiphilum TaxID=450365 RepID=UPI00191C347D|nr:outer membrane lipoprotein chaperone LolA [Aquabacterium fontiphilum]
MTHQKHLPRRACLILAASALVGLATPSHAVDAGAVQTLRGFVKEAQSGRAAFTQTVISPDGKRQRRSTGTLEFQRPDRFRFAYTTPSEQLIVADGQQVWLHDVDLEQVTVRPVAQAMGSTPAAILSSEALERDFVLKAIPAPTAGAVSATPSPAPGALKWEWVEATPRRKDGAFQSVEVGFANGRLAALDILDGFGQRTRLSFSRFETGVRFAPNHFQFTPPAGVDVLRQP